jgi:tRNA-binding EMAP/Myf-like protein
MIITKSKDHNENYLLKVVEIKSLRKHPNADRLSIFSVYSRDIITSSDARVGGVYVYFPIEVAISPEYLRLNNEYKDPTLNKDPTAKTGFFEEKGRVKAISLRGHRSEGYLVPIASFNALIGNKYLDLNKHIDEEFDTIDGHLLAWKYQVYKPHKEQRVGKQGQSAKREETRIIANQFRKHDTTTHLDKNLHRIKPDDIISITWKLHGTSFISSKVLCKLKLTRYQRLLKWLGGNILTVHYDNIYSSRNVIQNASAKEIKGQYYGGDIYANVNELFRSGLHSGETIYGEACGYTGTGTAIQKGYDYGNAAKKYSAYVYKITNTSNDGNVTVLGFRAMQERCEELGAKHVPLIYYGRADGISGPCTVTGVPELDEKALEQWREQFLDTLKAKYLRGQDSIFCANKVPEEGIVVVVEGLKPVAFKAINFAFRELESKNLDAGILNMEDDQ